MNAVSKSFIKLDQVLSTAGSPDADVGIFYLSANLVNKITAVNCDCNGVSQVIL